MTGLHQWIAWDNIPTYRDSNSLPNPREITQAAMFTSLLKARLDILDCESVTVEYNQVRKKEAVEE